MEDHWQSFMRQLMTYFRLTHCIFFCIYILTYQSTDLHFHVPTADPAYA